MRSSARRSASSPSLLPFVSSMIFHRIHFLVAALCSSLGARAIHAQSTVVRGHALAADGVPIPLSVVRLLPASGGRGRTTLTDAHGAFSFDTVAAGTYRLQMERIGYTAPASDEFPVGAGQISERTLRAAMRPVVLEAVSSGRAACYTHRRLAEAPAVQALWLEAQKAGEHRRAFIRGYSFRYDQSTRGAASIRILRDRRIQQDTTIISHPDSARALRERRERSGKPRGRSLPPDEGYLLADEFLETHCLEDNPQQDSAGMWALRFRPVAASLSSRDSVGFAGTLRLDPRTLAVRRIEFDLLKGGKSWGIGMLEYADVQTPFGTVRLPSRAWVRGDPRGLAGVLITGFAGTAETTNYRDFQRINPN